MKNLIVVDVIVVIVTFCNRCGPEYWWAHYRREERNPELSKLVRALEKLGLKR